MKRNEFMAVAGYCGNIALALVFSIWALVGALIGVGLTDSIQTWRASARNKPRRRRAVSSQRIAVQDARKSGVDGLSTRHDLYEALVGLGAARSEAARVARDNAERFPGDFTAAFQGAMHSLGYSA